MPNSSPKLAVITLNFEQDGFSLNIFYFKKQYIDMQ